jgi:MFS family permease
VGVGGEWGGSVLLSMEWARSNAHRGFITSWSQIGGPAGAMLANIAVLVFSWISGDHFLIWGWRIPFMLSIIMVGVGLYIRLGILETPVFQRLLVENRTERVPVVEVIKRQPRSIILTALARMGEQASSSSTVPRSSISRAISCSRHSAWRGSPRSSRSHSPGICRIASDVGACISSARLRPGYSASSTSLY